MPTVVAAEGNGGRAWKELARERKRPSLKAPPSCSSGALGLNDTQNRVSPTVVPGLNKKEITGGAAGATHTIIWTTDNDVYAAGQGKEGALGLGDSPRDPHIVSYVIEGMPRLSILCTSFFPS
jgi:alpha-tubulin suppressor-like RCC1 family protein